MRRKHQFPVSLSDDQLQFVLVAANSLPQQMRHAFLLRSSATIKLQGKPQSFIDSDNLTRIVDHALEDLAA